MRKLHQILIRDKIAYVRASYFRPSPNFLAGTTRAPAQLLPPCLKPEEKCHLHSVNPSLCHSSFWSLWLGSCKIAAAPHWRSPMLWKTVQHLLSGYFLPKTSNVRRNTRLALAMALNGLENDKMWILHVTHYSPLDWKWYWNLINGTESWKPIHFLLIK